MIAILLTSFWSARRSREDRIMSSGVRQGLSRDALINFALPLPVHTILLGVVGAWQVRSKMLLCSSLTHLEVIQNRKRSACKERFMYAFQDKGETLYQHKRRFKIDRGLRSSRDFGHIVTNFGHFCPDVSKCFSPVKQVMH